MVWGLKLELLARMRMVCLALKNVIKYKTPTGLLGMGRGAMAAQQTLDLYILVRIRRPSLYLPSRWASIGKMISQCLVQLNQF